MLNKTIIKKINKEIATDYNGAVEPNSGLNYNDEEQLKKALNIAEFAKQDYKEASYEEFSESLKYLFIALSSGDEDLKEAFSEFKKYFAIASFSGKDALRDIIRMTKYNMDIIALKNQIRKIDLSKNSNKENNIKTSSLIDSLIEVLSAEVESAKQAKDNSIKYSDIKSVDLDSINLEGSDGKVCVAKIPYLNAMIKNDIKYGLGSLGVKTLNGTSKILKMINK